MALFHNEGSGCRDVDAIAMGNDDGQKTQDRDVDAFRPGKTALAIVLDRAESDWWRTLGIRPWRIDSLHGGPLPDGASRLLLDRSNRERVRPFNPCKLGECVVPEVHSSLQV